MSLKKQSKRLFGTNGVRGVIGKDMTPDIMLNLGAALGSLRKGTVAVGRDTRTSGPALSHALKSGLLLTGCDVIDCGILPTPALQYLVKEHYDAGAMITASHNPPEYNGLKVIEPDGTEMGDDATIELENRFFSKSFTIQPWDKVGTESDGSARLEEYISAIVSHFPPDIGKNFTVVVDPGSGPASLTTPRILTRLGCRVHTINDQLDGRFPGRLPEPSAEGLRALSDAVVSTKAVFGVAHDGDADRAVFVDENGNYIEENQEFGVIAEEICSREKGLVVTPVSTSQIIEKIAEKYGSNIKYTPVGSIYVARTMLDHISAGEKVVFGGEGNGGLIFPNHQFCRDGGMTAAMMVWVLTSRNQSLSALVKKLPRNFMIKEKIHSHKSGALIAHIIQSFPHLKIDKTDGVKISAPSAWALIRPSGTEPFMRVIVESDTRENAEKFYQDIMSVASSFS